MCGQFMSQGEVARARKEHTCTWCYEKIEVGGKYLWVTEQDQREFYTSKLHPECNVAVSEYLSETYEDCYMPGEGIRGKPYTINDDAAEYEGETDGEGVQQPHV